MRMLHGFMLLVGSGVVACGTSDGGNTPTGTGGSSQNAGGAGGVSGAGGGSGGGGGLSTGSGGGGSPGGFCNPGTFYQDPVDTFASRNVVHCYSYPNSDGGIPVSDAPGIGSVKLPGPMVPGQEYSISIELVTDAPNAEIWTSSTECGFGEEKLWSGSMPKGIFCTTVHPTKPSKYILLVYRLGGAQQRSIALCPGAACPR